MGTQRELLSTQLTYYRTTNPKTGRSGPIPMGGLVTLAFTSGDGDDRLLRWITHRPEGELCTLTAAKIVFYAGDLDGNTLFEYQLHDAALVYWKEEFKATGTVPMTVTITISAAIQKIKGVTWIKPWRESRVLSEESAAHKEGVQRGVSDDRGNKEDGSALEAVVLEGTREAEAARDATANQLKRKHATYAGGSKNGKVVSGHSSNPKGCAEDDISRQLGPDAQMTGAKGWRRNKATGELEYRNIPVCPNCQSKYKRSQFPKDVKYNKGGAWDN